MEDIQLQELKMLSMDELASRMPRKHIDFCEHYFTDCYLNVIDAYLKVYPKVKRVTARINGSKLLSDTLVRAYIDKMQQQMRETQKVTREFLIDKTVENLKYGMNGRPEMIFDASVGKVVPSGNIIRDQRAINDSVRLLTELTGMNKETVVDQGLENELRGATEFVVSIRKKREEPKHTMQEDDDNDESDSGKQ